MQQRDESGRAIGIALLGVMSVMAWPIWLAAVSAYYTVSWTWMASALIPLALNLLVVALAFRWTQRLAAHYHRAVHALGERLHAGTHRHA